MEEDERIKHENVQTAAQAPLPGKRISTSLACRRHGQKRVSYSQSQPKIADEPVTTFCELLDCGNR